MSEKFLSLYNFIINSEDRENMRALGRVTKDMMTRLISTEPRVAQEYIERLESVKWNNYLTDTEADSITKYMTPKPEWSKSAWLNKAEQLDLELSEEPYFNENALYVEMCKIYSDNGKTIREHSGIKDEDEIFTFVYHLSLGELKDKDRVFNIRKYFNV